MIRPAAGWAVILLSTLAWPSAAYPQSYRVVEPPLVGIQTHDVNDSLRAVGVLDVGGRDVALTWQGSDLRVLSAVGPDASDLHINNTGMIAGVRDIDGDTRHQAVFVCDYNGNGYTETAFPLLTTARINGLTDSGIVLIDISYFRPDRFSVYDQRDFALYRGQVYELSISRDISNVIDIGEDGRALVQDRGVLGGRYLRWPDGRTAFPWPAPTPINAIGEGGHFAGASCCTPSGASTVSFGIDNRGVSTLGVQGNLQVRDINRAGDFVGYVYFTREEDRPNDYGYVVRSGAFIDLNSLVSIPGYHVLLATRITGTGAILAYIAPVGWWISTGTVVLAPGAPAAPERPAFTVSGGIVTLQWEAAPSALDYVVEAGSAPGLADLYNAPVGPGTFLTTPAPPGRYYVRVRARGAGGTSEPSTEMVIDVR